MASRPVKRSSDECVFTDIKKKKKTGKEKRDLDTYKEKPLTIVCNGDSRQKKAFFAYFGKSFDEGKNGASNCKDNTKKKNIEVNTDIAKQNTNINNGSHCFQIIETNKNNKNKINNVKPSTYSTKNNIGFVQNNMNLSYVSIFVEESGYFPKKTHTNWLAYLKPSDHILHLNEEVLHHNFIKNSIFSFSTLVSVSKHILLEPYEMEINFPIRISSLKKTVPNLPVTDIQKHMKKKYLEAKKSKTDVESMWTDKYKPICNEEVLGNNKLIQSLKNWLNPKTKNTMKLKKSKKYEEDDDFIFINDSGNSSNHKTHYNLAILLGPSGCGKTSAVYAVANEMNANVIELNASCNRNGKRIIVDLMEATQSHAVKKNSLLNMLEGKRKKIKNSKKKENANEKMTIILIEDADIFFDNYDDGFISAISTLATDSKRPLVLTANDPFNSHLLKFVLSDEMTFNFLHPPKEHLNCYLQLMALNEGVVISADEINTFVHPFKPDIRQSVIQLQYILSTGVINKKILNNTYKRSINSIWWNWPYMSACNSTDIYNENQAKSNSNIVSISQHLDNMLKLNLIYSKTQSYDFLDPQPFWHHLTIRDSASLIETNHWSDNSVQLSTDITQWIYSHINICDDNTEKLYPSSEDLSHRKRLWDTSRNLLEQIGLDYCNRKNETCFDYLSTIRSLGRNQQVNQQPFGNLRHSKIFSYLSKININVNSHDLKFVCDTFQSNSNCNEFIEISDQF